jgi:hypothetical protein
MFQSIINSVSAWYNEQSARTRVITAVVGLLAVAMFLYWFFVRYVGKNMSSGKSFKDTGAPVDTKSTSTYVEPTFSDSPQLFANELMVALEYTWALGFVCGNPDNLCYRLQSLANGSDDYVRAVGKAYSGASVTTLSDAIQKNPCECLKSCWTCRTTKYPANKAALVSKLKSFGY